MPILPLENAHVPPRLHAHQTRETLTEFEHGNTTDYSSAPLFSLDCYRKVSHPEDGTLFIYNHNPTLILDILGANIACYNALLPANNQDSISVNLN